MEILAHRGFWETPQEKTAPSRSAAHSKTASALRRISGTIGDSW